MVFYFIFYNSFSVVCVSIMLYTYIQNAFDSTIDVRIGGMIGKIQSVNDRAPTRIKSVKTEERTETENK